MGHWPECTRVGARDPRNWPNGVRFSWLRTTRTRARRNDIAVSPDGDRLFFAGQDVDGRPRIAAYGLGGEPLWSIGGTGEGYASELVVDANGVALVGRADGPMSLAGAELTGDGRLYFVVALDTEGGLQWSSTFDASDEDATIQEPMIATTPSRLAVIGSLDDGDASFDDTPVFLEEEGAVVHVFAR